METENQQIPNEGIERLRLKYGFLKFLLGTFTVSVLSIVINWQIQEKRLEFEISTKESDFIAQFLEHGLDKELEKRRDFAEYFVRLSPSEESRLRWENYLMFVKDLINQANEAEKLLSAKNKQLAALAAQVAQAQELVEKAQAEIEKKSGKPEKDANEKAEVQELIITAEKASEAAESRRKELEEIRTEIVNQRKELSSLRSSPMEVEVLLPITAENIATKSTKKEGYWDWTIFIQGPKDVLDQVKYVEYTLHPTFPNPVRIVTDPGIGPHAFPFKTSGWGTFTVKIQIFLQNGKVQNLTHQLHFP